MNQQPTPIEPDGDGQDSWIGDRLPPQSSFFPGTAYRDILERVHGLVENAAKITLLTGVQGAGKTTLLYRIQGDAPEHWLPCRVDANPMLHPDQLLARLARCIGLPEPDEEISESVDAAFCELRLQGRLPVIMVDDAEQLPVSSLMTLLRLHEQRADTTPACAVIFLARPEIQSALATVQLRALGTDRFVHLELPRLAQVETAEYVRHFLRMEGVVEEVEFSPQQLSALCRESGGLPGKVNDLVIRLLRDSTLSRHEPRSMRLVQLLRRIPPATALAIVVVVMLLLLTLLFQQQIDSLLQGPAQTGAAVPDTPREQRPSGLPGEREQGSYQPLPLPPVAERLDVVDEPYSQVPVLKPNTPTESAETAPPVETLPPVESASLAEPAPPAETAKLEVAAAEQQPVQPRPLPVPEEVPAISAPTNPEPKSAGTPKPDQPQPVAIGPRFEKEAWLLRQNPKAYSLQILAAAKEQSVHQFAQRHNLTTDVYYYKSQRNGRPWIVMLFGIYKDRKTAVTVLNMLPEPLVKAGAWPRSLRSIQEEIQRVR